MAIEQRVMDVAQLRSIVNIALRAVAFGMAVIAVILRALEAAPFETSVTFVSIGMFALAAASLSETDEDETSSGDGSPSPQFSIWREPTPGQPCRALSEVKGGKSNARSSHRSQ